MWNLNGDDIQRAKEELKGRRAAIQARYEAELKQLEVDISDIETFERFAVKFVSDFKGDDAPAAAVADPEPATADVVAELVAQVSREPSSPAPEAPVAQNAAAEAAASVEPAAGAMPEPAAGQKSASRWRMRLNTGDVAQ